MTAALAAPALAFGGEKVVHLDVEGRVTPVRTYADDAGDLIERTGVRTGRRDRITLASMREGGRVNVRRAKTVRLWVDGKPRRMWAHGLTVREGLASLGLKTDGRDFVFPDPRLPLLDNMTVMVRNAVHAKIVVGDEKKDVVSSAHTVGGLVRDAGIEMGPRDYTVPAATTAPKPDMTVRIVQVNRFVDTETVEIPFKTVVRNDSSLRKGERRVVQEGKEGLKLLRYRVVLENGRRAASWLMDSEVVRKPRDRVVKVGTASKAGSSGAAQPAFKPKGGSQTGIASWFGAEGMVAAHRTLPIGTTVRVTNLENGKTVTVRINQRGPFIEGRVIDLSDDAFAKIAPLGQGTVRVRLDT